MMNPDFFFESSSLRKSFTFSWNDLPAYLTGCTRTFSRGRTGRSLPQTRSTRFCWIPTSDEPFFSSVSANFRAPADQSKVNNHPLTRTLNHSHAVIKDGSTPTALPPWACSVVLPYTQHQSPGIFSAEYDPYHSCQVGTPSIPRFRSSQLLSSCFAAWLKYRPSVDRAALLEEMIAVPAEPENPEMNSVDNM